MKKIESESLKQFINSANDGILLFDSQLNHIEVNDTALKMVSLKREDVIGKNITETIPDVQESGRYQMYLDVIKTGEPIQLDDIHPHKKFNQDSVCIRAFKVAEGLGLFITDTSDLINAKETIRYQNEIAEHMSEGVVLIRVEDGQIVYTNNPFNKLFGYEEGELRGKPISIVNAPTQKAPEETAAEIIKSLHDNGSWRGEVENIRKDGSFFTCLASVSTFQHNEFGKVWVSVHEDISVKKQNEETVNTLLKSMVGYTGQEFFDRIVEILSDWLKIDCTIIGEITGKNVDSMAMWLDNKIVHGYSYSLSGTPCEQVRANGYCTYNDDIINRFPEDKDLVNINAEGYVGYPLLNKEGHAIGLLCAISRKPLVLPPNTEDIFKIISAKAFVEIERMQAERKLEEKNRQLDELNKVLEQRVYEETQSRLENERLLVQQSKMAAMGEMLSAIAHQWRQPLNNLGLIIQDIKEAYDYDEMNEEYIDTTILKSMEQIQFMSKTIDDFRNFYKPSKTSQDFSPEKAIEDVVSLLFAQAEEKKIQIKREHCCGEDCSLTGYPNEFKQALLNILHNAIDSIGNSYKNNKIEEGKGVITVKSFQKSGNIYIEIEDNGGGISPDHLLRIFEPYFTTKEEGKGTGIGLYMSEMIVKNMDGVLVAENTPDGVCFRIKF